MSVIEVLFFNAQDVVILAVAVTVLVTAVIVLGE